MNERIKELAKKCYETGPIGKDGWPEYSKFNEEKFAALHRQALIDSGELVPAEKVNRLEDQLSDAKIKVKLLRPDAERYRYLVNANPDDGPHVVMDRQDDWGNWRNDILTGVVLDEAIDRARSQP